MKEKDLFDFNQDLSLVDEVQNLALQKNLDLHEMLSGIAFNLFFALDLDIQNSCRDFCKIYSLWCGEEQNNHLLLTLQNFLQDSALSELLDSNRKRMDWCLESWYEAFPYTKIQLQQIGDDEISLLFKTQRTGRERNSLGERKSKYPSVRTTMALRSTSFNCPNS